MYINQENTTICTNEKLNVEMYSENNKEGYFFLDSNIEKENNLILKLNNFECPKLLIENGVLIDIVEDIEKNKQQELNYTVIEDKPSQTEIDFAEYVLKNESEIENLKNEINNLKGSVING